MAFSLQSYKEKTFSSFQTVWLHTLRQQNKQPLVRARRRTIGSCEPTGTWTADLFIPVFYICIYLIYLSYHHYLSICMYSVHLYISLYIYICYVSAVLFYLFCLYAYIKSIYIQPISMHLQYVYLYPSTTTTVSFLSIISHLFIICCSFQSTVHTSSILRACGNGDPWPQNMGSQQDAPGSACRTLTGPRISDDNNDLHSVVK